MRTIILFSLFLLCIVNAHAVPNGAGSEIFNTNVGIATLTPQGALAVIGNVGIGTWTAAGGNLIVMGGGNVGINSAWPQAALDVHGTSRMAGFNLSSSPNSGYVLISDANGNASWTRANSPVGTTPQLQYNNSGSFVGVAGSGADANGNLGLGTTGPHNSLDIVGNVGIGTIKYSSFVTSTAPNGGMIVEKNIGIGSIAPEAALDVNGTIDINGVNGLSFPTDNTANASTAIGSGALSTQAAAGAANYYNTALGFQAVGIGTMTASSVQITAIGYQADGNATGFIGYAPTIGYQAFDTNATLVGNDYGAIGFRAFYNGGNTQDTAVGSQAGILNSQQAAAMVGYNSQAEYFQNSFGSQAGQNEVNGTEIAFGFQAAQNSAFGSVVIGAGAEGNSTGTNTTASQTAIGENAGLSNTASSNSVLIGYGVGSTTLATGGYDVLIGTSSAVDTPASNTSGLLNIGNLLQGDMTYGTESLYLQSTASGVDYLQVAGGASGNPGLVTVSAQGTDSNVGIELLPKGTGNVGIGTSTPQGGFVVVDGNVGIGTWAPGAALIVQGGNVGIGTNKANYNLQIGGCTSKNGTTSCVDLAELIPSSQALSAGDVVMLDARSAVTVMKAVNRSNNLLFGVVTSNPAIVIEGSTVGIMNGKGYVPDPMKPAIALAGRVPVKTNLENGAIAIGDMIGSSSSPGIGSKAVDPGRVIGMALEPLNDLGQDAYKDILVYVDPHWWPGQERHHWAQVEDPQDLFDLALLCASGKNLETPTPVIKSKVCARPADPAVLGAYAGLDGQGRAVVRSSGRGYLIVANKGEDLDAGDYLVTSDLAGMAQRQTSGGRMNYTAAKLKEKIHWKPGEISRKAAVVYEDE